MGRLNNTFTTLFSLVFPEREYSTIWRYSSAETGVKKNGAGSYVQLARTHVQIILSVWARPLAAHMQLNSFYLFLPCDVTCLPGRLALSTYC